MKKIGKYLFCLIILIVVSFRILGQSTIKINLPQVSESKSVDSLLDKVIKSSHSYRGFIEIAIYNTATGYEFELWGKEKINNFFDFGYNPTKTSVRIIKYNDKMRYFNYRGFTIFIDHDYGPKGMFKETGMKKEFIVLKEGISRLKETFFTYAIYNYKGYRFIALDLGIHD